MLYSYFFLANEYYFFIIFMIETFLFLVLKFSTMFNLSISSSIIKDLGCVQVPPLFAIRTGYFFVSSVE